MNLNKHDQREVEKLRSLKKWLKTNKENFERKQCHILPKQLSEAELKELQAKIDNYYLSMESNL